MAFAFIFDSVGGTEWLVLLGVILIVVGPKNLPSAARKFGKVMAQLRRAADEFKRQIMSMDEEVRRTVDEAVKTDYVDTPTDAGAENDDPYPGHDFYDETNYETEEYAVNDASAGVVEDSEEKSNDENASVAEEVKAEAPVVVDEPVKPKVDPYAVKITVSTNANKEKVAKA